LLSELKVLSRSELLKRLLFKLRGEKVWAAKLGGGVNFLGGRFKSEINIDWHTLPFYLGLGIFTVLN